MTERAEKERLKKLSKAYSQVDENAKIWVKDEVRKIDERISDMLEEFTLLKDKVADIQN